MTFRRALSRHIEAQATSGVHPASTAVAGPDDLAPLPCLPGCLIDHTHDVAAKCCETATLIGAVTPSYGEPSIEVTAHSYTEGTVRSAEIQLGTAPHARFLDPVQALALAQLLVDAVTKANTAALG